MSTTTFYNDQTLASTALTPDAIEALLQPTVARMLGLDPDQSPEQAFSAVRIGWQQEGQPAPLIDEDVCILTARVDNAEFSRVNDDLKTPASSERITQTTGFTQVWTVHCTFYGPNSMDRARLLLSAVRFDWAMEAFETNNLYVLPALDRPVYAPEPFEGRWWKRADIDLRFNELVIETTTIPAAAGVDVTLIKDTGLSTEIHIRK